jgi:hypothetical protein
MTLARSVSLRASIRQKETELRRFVAMVIRTGRASMRRVQQMTPCLVGAGKSFLLIEAVVAAGSLCCMEAVIRGIASSPGKVLGAEPIGVKPVVRLWAWVSLWGTTRVRALVGLYVRRFYPRLFRRWKTLFST